PVTGTGHRADAAARAARRVVSTVGSRAARLHAGRGGRSLLLLLRLARRRALRRALAVDLLLRLAGRRRLLLLGLRLGRLLGRGRGLGLGLRLLRRIRLLLLPRRVGRVAVAVSGEGSPSQ